MDPWPDILMESFNKLTIPFYHTMWGPGELTQTGNLRDFERAEDLRSVMVPNLFTCGEYDEANPATTEYYKSWAQNADMIVFEGASHPHHMERKAQFNQAVRDFLNKAE